MNHTLRQDVWVNFPNFNETTLSHVFRSGVLEKRQICTHNGLGNVCEGVTVYEQKHTPESSVLLEKRYTCSHALRDEPTAVGTTTTPREDTVRLGSEH